MFRRMTIQLRLGLVMAGTGVLAVIVAVTGLSGMRHANLRVQDTYAVQLARTVALAQADSNPLSLLAVLDRAAMAPNAPGVDNTIERARPFLAQSDAAWERYRALAVAAPAVQAFAKDQQRVPNVAAKSAMSAPKLPAPKLVAAGGDPRNWELF